MTNEPIEPIKMLEEQLRLSLADALVRQMTQDSIKEILDGILREKRTWNSKPFLEELIANQIEELMKKMVQEEINNNSSLLQNAVKEKLTPMFFKKITESLSLELENNARLRVFLSLAASDER